MAGTASSPASPPARQRRSPAISSKLPPATGRTRTGWRTPRSLIDSASSSSVCWSNSRRGWCGVGVVSPRPIPRALSATGGNLLCQFEIGVRPGAVGIVVDHRLAEARCLPDSDVARDHGIENQFREMLAHLTLDVLERK